MSDLLPLDRVIAELGIGGDFVTELVESRLLHVHDGHLTRRGAERLRVAWTLHRELGVNLAGIEVILPMLDRLEAERMRTRSHLHVLRALLLHARLASLPRR